jgi:hypothetical protein
VSSYTRGWARTLPRSSACCARPENPRISHQASAPIEYLHIITMRISGASLTPPVSRTIGWPGADPSRRIQPCSRGRRLTGPERTGRSGNSRRVQYRSPPRIFRRCRAGTQSRPRPYGCMSRHSRGYSQWQATGLRHSILRGTLDSRRESCPCSRLGSKCHVSQPVRISGY